MALLSRLGVHGTSVSEIRGNPLLLLDSDSVRAFVRLHKFFSRDRSTSTLAFRILCLFSTDVNDIVVGWEGSCTKEWRTIGRHFLFSNRNLPSHHRFTLIVDWISNRSGPTTRWNRLRHLATLTAAHGVGALRWVSILVNYNSVVLLNLCHSALVNLLHSYCSTSLIHTLEFPWARRGLVILWMKITIFVMLGRQHAPVELLSRVSYALYVKFRHTSLSGCLNASRTRSSLQLFPFSHEGTVMWALDHVLNLDGVSIEAEFIGLILHEAYGVISLVPMIPRWVRHFHFPSSRVQRLHLARWRKAFRPHCTLLKEAMHFIVFIFKAFLVFFKLLHFLV
jgi:hypothetical protein